MSLIALPPLAVLALLFMVIRLRLHAFLSLLLVSVAVGLLAGMDGEHVLKAVETGMGSTVGFIAVVVGLGSMFGAMLEVSGGAQLLARTLVSAVGIERAPWALALTGFVVGISVFFDVGFILLVPLIYSLGRETDRSIIGYALPLLAGLAVTHAFLPPHPGPVAVAQMVHAEFGTVILYGALAGIPGIILSCLAARFLARVVQAPPLPPVEEVEGEEAAAPPSFGVVLLLVLTPVALIVCNTIGHATIPDSRPGHLLLLIGHPFIALSIAVLMAFLLLGRARGLSAADIQKLSDRSLKPGGQIILVTGSGGIFKEILSQSGAGPAVAGTLAHTGLSPLLLAFLLALLVRVSLGSTTVSMMTAAGLVYPMLGSFPHLNPALVTVAIASGSLACSHVNDSGFWLVKQYLGMTESQTLKTWTVITTIIGFTGIAVVMLLSLFV